MAFEDTDTNIDKAIDFKPHTYACSKIIGVSYFTPTDTNIRLRIYYYNPKEGHEHNIDRCDIALKNMYGTCFFKTQSKPFRFNDTDLAFLEGQIKQAKLKLLLLVPSSQAINQLEIIMLNESILATDRAILDIARHMKLKGFNYPNYVIRLKFDFGHLRNLSTPCTKEYWIQLNWR